MFLTIFFLVIFSVIISGYLDYKEKWGYIEVRPGAYLFWWLYYVENERPLVMWLQGGPGGSSTGFGNFEEIGPIDEDEKNREIHWLLRADLLFVDQPVGSGFSYVSKKADFVKNSNETNRDLLVFTKKWFSAHSEYKKKPFYIFGESYGGKTTASFAEFLHKSIEKNETRLNFQGISLVSGWISPFDFVNSWATMLHAFSFLDMKQLNQINSQAAKCEKSMENGHWFEASECVLALQPLIYCATNGASWYNLLKMDDSDPWSSGLALPNGHLIYDKCFVYSKREWSEKLQKLMNRNIRKKLGIVPKFVKWQLYNNDVSLALEEDFLRPVSNSVDYLLKNTNLKVVIMVGQLDLICNHLGMEKWLSDLTWPYLQNFQNSTRRPFLSAEGQTEGFVKSYKNLQFYWFMNAGHMIPHDSEKASLKMLDVTLGNCVEMDHCNNGSKITPSLLALITVLYYNVHDLFNSDI